MNELTPDEIEGLVEALHAPELSEEQRETLPLREPGSLGPVTKLSFSPLEGEHPKPLERLTSKAFSRFENVEAHVEVVYGKRKTTLRELAALKKGDLFLLDELCDELVEIYVNGVCVGKGEVVSVDGKFGVRIASFVT